MSGSASCWKVSFPNDRWWVPAHSDIFDDDDDDDDDDDADDDDDDGGDGSVTVHLKFAQKLHAQVSQHTTDWYRMTVFKVNEKMTWHWRVPISHDSVSFETEHTSMSTEVTPTWGSVAKASAISIDSVTPSS